MAFRTPVGLIDRFVRTRHKADGARDEKERRGILEDILGRGVVASSFDLRRAYLGPQAIFVSPTLPRSTLCSAYKAQQIVNACRSVDEDETLWISDLYAVSKEVKWNMAQWAVPESILTSFHATPTYALRARHSPAMHFSAFAGSNVEAFESILKLEQAMRNSETVMILPMEGTTVNPTAAVRVED
ncbi:hypothetical protein H4582DRAFT_2128011 [Lactarius indigo]|nr:hypothetical protein H4582DRAFT_2128011 [Lactarius indigo]